jgi:flagellar biogenesis protein FliO
MEYTQQMLAAAAVLGLLVAVLWWTRRRGWTVGAAGSRAERRLETLERLALSPHHTLHLVRVGDEALVVACSPAGCALLDRVPARATAELTGARP